MTADDFEVVREAVRFAPQPELDRALTALERIEERLSRPGEYDLFDPDEETT